MNWQEEFENCLKRGWKRLFSEIDVEKVKRELIEGFTKEVNKCKSVEDIVHLLYRYPGCGHSCPISHVIMDILEKNGITEDVYWEITTPEAFEEGKE